MKICHQMVIPTYFNNKIVKVVQLENKTNFTVIKYYPYYHNVYDSFFIVYIEFSRI